MHTTYGGPGSDRAPEPQPVSFTRQPVPTPAGKPGYQQNNMIGYAAAEMAANIAVVPIGSRTTSIGKNISVNEGIMS